MTARGFYLLLFGSLMLFTALSVGSSGAFLLGTAALFCWALSLLCVCLAAFSCRVDRRRAAARAAFICVCVSACPQSSRRLR